MLRTQEVGGSNPLISTEIGRFFLMKIKAPGYLKGSLFLASRKLRHSSYSCTAKKRRPSCTKIIGEINLCEAVFREIPGSLKKKVQVKTVPMSAPSLLRFQFNLLKLYFKRGCSSAGRALALHARGRGFDSPHLHHLSHHKRRVM